MGELRFGSRLIDLGLWKALALGAVLGVLVFAPEARAAQSKSADTVRLKDLGKLKGWEENALVGYGIVTGLAGTGDSSTNPTTRQAMSNVLGQFNLAMPASQIQSRNVAVVMITAALPPFAREGDTFDVTVTSAGDAKSLLGGSLILSPLKAANGRVYALAQGSLSVGGYRYDSNGNVMQKNHPTVGSVPNGAKVEIAVNDQILSPDQSLTFVLTDPDYTTANRIATEINRQLGAGLAEAQDASGIQLHVPPDQQRQLVAFIAKIENVNIEPDRRARVVVNERTGTVVSGGDVRISQVAISHGDLKISIATTYSASQPNGTIGANRGARTVVVGNTKLDVAEPEGPGYVPPGSNTVADLVQSLTELKTDTRDVISILRAVKAAGALHAELIIQ